MSGRMLTPEAPALALAPMDGITDAPMRALQGELGAFTYAVTEFIRVSTDPLPKKVFVRDVPELATEGRTATGLPVHVQILGGNPEHMALS
ncbi:tRNA-dihydrouridine synthase family protein, partial [bacterium]